MGVNMAGYCITDDEVCREASCQEIIRRYYKTACQVKLGREKPEPLEKIVMIMQQLGLRCSDRHVVDATLSKAKESGHPACAIELDDGRIITGRKTQLTSASSSCVLNAIKSLAGIADEIMLITPETLEPILDLKHNILGSASPVLKLDDVLTALSISAVMNPYARQAVQYLKLLKGCDMHSSQLLRSGDEGTIRKLGINLTCEPVFPENDILL